MNDIKDILLELKKKRESLGLSLDYLYSKTKIRLQLLKQIDEGDLTGIEPVYALSFIKSICLALKMNPEEIDDIIERSGLNSKKQKDYKANVYTQQVDFSKSVFKNQSTIFSNLKSFLDVKYLNYAIYFFLFILIVSIIYFSVFTGSNSGDQLSKKNIDTLVIDNKNKELESHFVPDTLILEARGLDTAWLRIQIDGKHSEQIVMVPKMERQWHASKYIMLSAGNGGAIEFRRNGKVLEPFGTKGSVVRNVKITSTEIVVSSSPWSITTNDTTTINRKKLASKKKNDEVKPEPPPKKLGESSINPPAPQIRK